MALHNLAVHLAEAGQSQAALVSVEEAVSIWRGLARDEPGAYLGNLAAALASLAARLGTSGQREAAIAPAREAVDVTRRLAGDNPAVYLPSLATALNNLGAVMDRAGRPWDAIPPLHEAVRQYRKLVSESPDAYLPELARALTGLSNYLARVGQGDLSTAPASEAVAIHRRLASQNPDAYLPGLAHSLRNLAERLAQDGQRDAALTTAQEAANAQRHLAQNDQATQEAGLIAALMNLAARLAENDRSQDALTTAGEALTIIRRLADDNPAVHLPDLAISLTRLASMLADDGQSEAPQAAAREAVTIWRQLARDSPGPYLSGLAIALSTLASLLADSGQPDQALAETDASLGSLPPWAQAELLLARHRWRNDRNDPPGAAEDLLHAAAITGLITDPAEAGRLRRAVRAGIDQARTRGTALEAISDELPDWAAGDLPGSILQLVSQWQAVTSWDQQETLLNGARDQIINPDGCSALRLAEALHPDQPAVAGLARIAADMAERGFAQVLSELRDTRRHADLIRDWLAASSWPESLALLRAHPDLITDQRTLAALPTGAADPVVARHAATAPRGALLYPRLSREGLEGRFLGLMAYLEGKPEGNNSMPEK